MSTVQGLAQLKSSMMCMQPLIIYIHMEGMKKKIFQSPSLFVDNSWLTRKHCVFDFYLSSFFQCPYWLHCYRRLWSCWIFPTSRWQVSKSRSCAKQFWCAHKHTISHVLATYLQLLPHFCEHFNTGTHTIWLCKILWQCCSFSQCKYTILWWSSFWTWGRGMGYF